MPFIEAKLTLNIDETKKNLIADKLENIVSGNFHYEWVVCS